MLTIIMIISITLLFLCGVIAYRNEWVYRERSRIIDLMHSGNTLMIDYCFRDSHYDPETYNIIADRWDEQFKKISYYKMVFSYKRINSFYSELESDIMNTLSDYGLYLSC